MRNTVLVSLILALGLFIFFQKEVRAQNAYARVLAEEPGKNDEKTPLTGKLHVFPLKNDTIVLAGDYDSFINDRVIASHGKRLALADKLNAEGALKDWAHRFFYSFAFVDSASYYNKRIRDNFDSGKYFNIESSSKGALKIARSGYLPGAAGEKRIPKSDGTRHIASGADIIHFAYIELEKPLENGEEVNIATTDGAMKTKFVYDDSKTVSRAIKINQVGYMPSAPKKFAYFGMWMGPLGEMKVDEFENEKFEIIDSEKQQKVYEGTIKLRSKEQYHQTPKMKNPLPLTGETVMELDFSDFQTPGNYRIRIPNAGVSYPFVISDDAIGKAFYVNMRGLYHQRSGIAKTPEFTNWNFKADHMKTYRGGFAPNDRHYNGKRSNAMFDSEGKPVTVKTFDMVAATATDELLPDVYGGWWDAGDFDRRTYHFQIVDALLSVYFMFPENFSDSQLDIPESGNGVPDIIDEAAWGVDVWRRAQNEKGGVGCWIEAVSHPVDGNPDTDEQKYYLALPTRESSMEYAAYAAKLARAYKKAGAIDKADLFYKSATSAYDYAKNPANRQEKIFSIPKKGEYKYIEPEMIPVEIEFKAALNLYLYSKDAKYEPFLETPINFDSIFKFVRENKRPYYLSELLEDNEFPEYRRAFSNHVVSEADKYLESQESLSYRNINWPLNHNYFQYLAWGGGLPFYKGSYFIAAMKADGDEKYRTAALLLADWMHGTNPMGRSMTTGLGSVYPVRILSHPLFTLEKQGINDPIPGITPYTFSGQVNYAASKYVFKMEYNERADTNFAGCDITLLPSAWLAGKDTISLQECYNTIRKYTPLWRRFINLESKAVDQNEFTVWETMAPAAAAYGALLGKDWKPQKDWKKIQPVKKVEDIEGRIFLP